MSLSCDCGFDDEEMEWYSWEDADFTILDTARRRRCCSCGKLIDLGENVLKFNRGRDAKTEIEIKIYGDNGPDVPLAPWYHCFDCGGIFLTLQELGFCSVAGEDVRQDLKDYQVDYAHESWRKNNV